MARPKGTLNEDTTRDLTWLVALRALAEREGYVLSVRAAAELVVQNRDRGKESCLGMLGSVAAGDLALSDEVLDECAHLADERERRALEADQTKRGRQRASTLAKRERYERTGAAQASLSTSPRDPYLKPRDPRFRLGSQVAALQRAYWDRGHELESETRAGLDAVRLSDEALEKTFVLECTKYFGGPVSNTHEGLPGEDRVSYGPH